MEGALVSAAGEPAKFAIVLLEREFGYLVHFKRNIVNLRNMMDQLLATTSDVQTLVNAAEDNNELVRETVQTWLRKAEIVIEEAAQLISEAGYINSWCRGWCCSRFGLGRKAEKMIAVIKGLLDDRSIIGDTVSDPKPYQCLEIVSGGDFDAFASRRSTTELLINSLSDETVSLIGVFGMPGVGKTVLVQAIAKQAKEDKLFDAVVIATVSQNPVLERIQGDIADALGLKLREGDTSDRRAVQLFDRLHKGKKVLIVLDDMWERLKLATEVGIPFKNKNSGCKVIFTTRHESVCNQMEIDRKIEVAVLSEEDSCSLFYKKAVVSGTEFGISDEISKGIVNECKGLPLAIVTLGLTLRGNNGERVWEAALAQLRTSVFKDMGPVVSSIKLSYDSLPHDADKLCFLFCCLFPEDFRISFNVLLSYVIGEDLLKNVDTLAEARGRLQWLVSKLVSSNLLLRDGDGKLKMHDVIRDVAISIASEDSMLGFVVKAGMRLIDWPDMELNACKRISVMLNRIKFNSQYQVKAQHLLTLSMRYNMILTKLPDDFFFDMESLLTLDLSRTGIKSLPPSLSRLVKLRTLLIERCNLESLSPIHKFQSLQILSLRHSKIKRWPDDMGDLKCMRLLDLSYSRWNERIPPKVYASMLRLEELYMLDDSIPKPFGTKLEMKDCVAEISSLTRLTSLEVHVRSPTCLSKEIPNWENLRKFKLYVSSEMSNQLSLRESEESRRLDNVMYLEIPSDNVGKWLKVLVAKTQCLYLSSCNSLENVAELDGTGLNELRFLSISDCNEMKHLMDTSGAETPKSAFRNLEVLIIHSADSLEGLCSGMLPGGFLCKLRVLKLQRCKGIISLRQADLSWLQKLEHLQIRSCTSLEELVQPEERENAVPSGNSVATHTMSKKSSTSKFISSRTPSQIFPNLKFMTLYHCDKVKYIFSLSVARNLLQLTECTITTCATIKTIFEKDSGEDASNNTDTHKLVLPCLKKLHLRGLPELFTLSPLGVLVDCPSLEDLKLRQCQKLVRLPFGAGNIPKIQVLNATRELFDKLEFVDGGAKSRLSEVLDENVDTLET